VVERGRLEQGRGALRGGGLTRRPVYATAARGLRTRAASAAADRARRRRHRRFVELVEPRPSTRIVDVGCGPAGLRAWAPELDVTGVDVRPQPDYPGPFVQADAGVRLPFGDGEFDLAYSNSVIEHVAPAARPAFAAEIRRVARGWWVQTPAYGFPVEPHALLPGAHWLPVRLRRRYWRLGVAGAWEEIELMRRRELVELFGPEVVPERIGPLVKSWIAVRVP
jgi:SAM-dependent methyltransferase